MIGLQSNFYFVPLGHRDTASHVCNMPSDDIDFSCFLIEFFFYFNSILNNNSLNCIKSAGREQCLQSKQAYILNSTAALLDRTF